MTGQRRSLSGRGQKLPAMVARWEFLNRGSNGRKPYYGLRAELPALAAIAGLERDGDAAEASTALIITMNREHDAAVKQAAPNAPYPGCEAAWRRVDAGSGGIQFTHGF